MFKNHGCLTGKLNCVSWLLQRGVNVNYASTDRDLIQRNSPLLIACQSNHLPLAKVLVRHGAHFTTSECEADPLSLLLERNCDVEIVKLLLESSTCTVASASLETACELGAQNILSILLSFASSDAIVDSNILTLALDQESHLMTSLIMHAAKNMGILVPLLSCASARSSWGKMARMGNSNFMQLFITFLEPALIPSADSFLCSALSELTRATKSDCILKKAFYSEPSAVVALGLLSAGSGSSPRSIGLALRHSASRLQELVPEVHRTMWELQSKLPLFLRDALSLLPLVLIDLIETYVVIQVMDASLLVLLKAMN